jgi:signal transduction histidine kinase
MTMQTALRPVKDREWRSFHGNAVPLPSDPFETGRDFVSALHHRLCQPLTSLACALEVMQSGKEIDHGLNKQLQSLLMQSEKLVETMGMFRQLFEAESADHGFHAVMLGEVLQEVVEDLLPLAELQQVSVESKGSEGRRFVDMPQKTLRQALWNLVQNCIEVTSPGGTVSIAQQAESLTVTDTSGATSVEIENVFDPFSFCENKVERTRVANLPLAVTQRTVLAAGGDIRVTQAPGGRRFELRFRPSWPAAE